MRERQRVGEPCAGASYQPEDRDDQDDRPIAPAGRDQRQRNQRRGDLRDSQGPNRAEPRVGNVARGRRRSHRCQRRNREHDTDPLRREPAFAEQQREEQGRRLPTRRRAPTTAGRLDPDGQRTSRAPQRSPAVRPTAPAPSLAHTIVSAARSGGGSGFPPYGTGLRPISRATDRERAVADDAIRVADGIRRGPKV